MNASVLKKALATLAGGVGAALSLVGACHATPAGNPGCHLTLTASPGTWSIAGYNPFSIQTASTQTSVTLANDGVAACAFDLSVFTESEPYGLSNGGQLLPYSLFDSTGGVDVTPLQGQTPKLGAIRHLSLASGAQVTTHYAFNVYLSQLPADGTYVQHIVVAAQQTGSNNDHGADVSHDVTLQLQVAPSAVISLRGVFERTKGGGASIDLGDLKPGPIAEPLQLYVQSTRGYQISAHSQNAGELKLGDSGAWQIQYGLTLGSHGLNLASDPSFSVAGGALARQDLLPVGFTIGDTSERRAGAYSDVITVSVSPF